MQFRSHDSVCAYQVLFPLISFTEAINVIRIKTANHTHTHHFLASAVSRNFQLTRNRSCGKLISELARPMGDRYRIDYRLETASSFAVRNQQFVCSERKKHTKNKLKPNVREIHWGLAKFFTVVPIKKVAFRSNLISPECNKSGKTNLFLSTNTKKLSNSATTIWF